MNWELPTQSHGQIEVWLSLTGDIFTVNWSGSPWSHQAFYSQLLIAMGGEFMGFL